MPRPAKHALATLGGMKADYAGMVDNRFRRQRVGVSSVGGSGDSHYYNETRFIRMREYVRAMVRDDSAFKFLVNRSVQNEHGVGYQYEPDTGDKGVDRLLKDAFDEWGGDRRRCDASGRRTLWEMGAMVAFSDKVDGDVFAAGQEDGAVRLFEADEVRTPTWAKNRKIVHGIELDDHRRHVRYYLVKDQVNPQAVNLRLDQLNALPVYDDEGYEQVWQVCDSHRIRQTRGITVAHPIFDKATMYEDIDFALLVKQQFAALIAWFLKRDENFSSDYQGGSRTHEQQADGTTRTLEEVAPGAFIRGNKGEDLQLKSANIPSAETMEHLRHTLQMICLNLNLPYAVGMLDGSRESFSGIRFVVDMARYGWEMSRNRYDSQFYRQVAVFRTRHLLAEDRVLSRLATAKQGKRRFNVFRHFFQKPAWRYPQPLHDAQAGAIKLQTGQQSLVDFHAENGSNFKQFVKDNVGANAYWIGRAIRATEKIKQKYGEAARDLHWRDVYGRDFYRGGQAIDNLDEPNGGEEKKVSAS